MNEKYPHGDPTPIIRSINEAVRILAAKGIFIDLTQEMPRAADQNYWNNLRALHDRLWTMVYAKNPSTAACEVTHVHDDGDVTLDCGGVEHVATTEGKLYREISVSDPELSLRRICKNGPVAGETPYARKNRRLIPEDEIKKAGAYIAENTRPDEVDPEFIQAIVLGSDRYTNKDYESARVELLELFRYALAKSAPTLYDKFRKCLGG